MARAGSRRPPLWRCPRCGHRFVTRNLWHSCGRHALADHLRGRDPRLRRLFDSYVRFLRGIGPVTVYAQKTRIVIMARVRFTGAIVRKDHLRSGFYSRRWVDHPRFDGIQEIAPRAWHHGFALRDRRELDGELLELARMAYRVGTQEDLGRALARRGSGRKQIRGRSRT